MTRLNEPVLDHIDGDNGVVDKIITIVPADPVVKGQEIKGDDGAFIHYGVVVLCECACHALAEETLCFRGQRVARGQCGGCALGG